MQLHRYTVTSTGHGSTFTRNRPPCDTGRNASASTPGLPSVAVSLMHAAYEVMNPLSHVSSGTRHTMRVPARTSGQVTAAERERFASALNA